ncbi:MAG: hypothetical protein E6Q69_05025 [Aquipseudomonas alcaligenes]|uniref:Uncharacterized protein n=1 Tax=Aquipseudomonas alcaligenes TaxID=43263 RepID=A0A5C7WBL1_AQUAC|nr:MAG: hypothetical protein E6Q69_05025 [Pseudomonas alcaligenes]
MQQYIERMINLPYWVVALLVSVLFAAGIFVAFTIGAGLDVAIKAAPVLGLLSLCGFGAAKLVMPEKPQGN